VTTGICDGATVSDPSLHGILALIAERSGIDFRDYRSDTLRNRLHLRMRTTGCAELATYRARLLADGEEVDRAVEALVVPVTEFFRDGWVFEELADRVLPALPISNGLVRAWVVGAASGEEACTVAILLAEAAARGRGHGFEVIASDLDQRSLEIARRGVYSERALQAVPAPLRQRYFRCEGNGYRMVEWIRGHIRFAQHDLVGPTLAPKEAVIAAFDLVLCRNVLLYFDAPLRAKALDRLSAVLEPGGALMLGTSESLPEPRPRRLEPWPGATPGSGIFRRAGG
jgi:two-component system CheB/CheR fusion protein